MPTVTIPRSRIEKGTLPHVCLVCGGRAKHYLFPNVIAPSLAWILFFPLLGLLTFWVYVILPGRLSPGGKGGLPFCRRHRSYWPRRGWFIVTGFALIVATFAAAVIIDPPNEAKAEQSPHWIFGIAGCWMILFLPMFLLVHLRAVRPTGNAGNALCLSRVHSDFADALEEKDIPQVIEEGDEPEVPSAPWRGRERVRRASDAAPGSRMIECPSCGSSRVERRPSQISPRPGYRCRNCGTLMRERGTLFLYIIVLAIGCGFAGVFVYGVANEIITPDRFVYALIGAICAVYSIRQMMRPLPRRRAKEAEE